MTKQDIIDAIELRVQRTGYSAWYIGITNDPERRKTEHGAKEDVQYWKQWQAGVEDARAIEEFFHAKGMKGDGGGGSTEDKPDWVYIF